MKKSPLRRVSPKQREKNKLWDAITRERIEELGGICEWCGKPGRRDDEFNPLEGHHTIKRRYNIHTKENCYVCHRLPCHSFITDNSISVDKVPNLQACDEGTMKKWLTFIGG